MASAIGLGLSAVFQLSLFVGGLVELFRGNVATTQALALLLIGLVLSTKRIEGKI